MAKFSERNGKKSGTNGPCSDAGMAGRRGEKVENEIVLGGSQ